MWPHTMCGHTSFSYLSVLSCRILCAMDVMALVPFGNMHMVNRFTSFPMRLITFVLLMFVMQTLAAQSDDLEELDGLLVDHTITRMGHDFYRDFSAYWMLNFSGADYNLSLHERPSARWGSLVWVEYRSQQVYRSFLRPNTAGIQDMAELAAAQVKSRVDQLRVTEAFEDRFDLEEDEL